MAKNEKLPIQMYEELEKLTKEKDYTTKRRLQSKLNLNVDKKLISEPKYQSRIKARKTPEKLTKEDKVDEDRYISYDKYRRLVYIEGKTKESRSEIYKTSLSQKVLYYVAAALGYSFDRAMTLIEEANIDSSQSRNKPISTGTSDYLESIKHKSNSYEEFLKGGWDFYYYNSGETGHKVFKTSLWLDYKVNEINLTAYLMFTNGDETTLFEGTAEVEKGSLIIKIEKNKVGLKTRIYLCSKLPRKHLKTQTSDWILNMGAVTNGGDIPATGNVILVKNHLKNKEGLFERGIKSVKLGVSELEDQIKTFLYRHRDRGIIPFRTDTVNGIKKQNHKRAKKLKRENYGILKKLLQKNNHPDYGWYSFSRVVPSQYGITLFDWAFEFNDVEHIVTVTRERLKNRLRKGEEENYISSYKGEILLESDQLYARLRDETEHKPKLKSFVAMINSSNDNVLQAISATTYPEAEDESRNIAVRELLCYIRKDSFKKYSVENGIYTFWKFFSLTSINDQHKFYLSSRALSTLSFPSKENYKKHYIRIKNASKYRGSYFILIRDIYSKEERNLLLLTLQIKETSNVTMVSNHPKNKGIVTYYGRVECYSNNLHMHLETDTNDPNEQKIVNFILNTQTEDNTPIKIKNKFDSFTGVCIDTDNQNTAVTYPFIMLRRSLLGDFMHVSQSIHIDEVDSALYASILPAGYNEDNAINYFFELGNS